MTLKDLFSENASTLMKFVRSKNKVTTENVFQEGNREIRYAFSEIIGTLTLPGSRVIGEENLFALAEKAAAGKKCLILPEHYSNLDYPLIIKLFTDLGEKGVELADRCVAMAGVKLSESDDLISMFTDGYDTVFVYPGRTLQTIKDPEKLKVEMQKARKINLASMRMMDELRANGRIVVVFPAGTRYRPGHPETKRGLREIDSYIKTADYMVLLSINGNCLEVNSSSDMTADIVKKDRIILEASEVLDCQTFRKLVMEKLPDGADKKQSIIDEIMARLETMHRKNDADSAKDNK